MISMEIEKIKLQLIRIFNEDGGIVLSRIDSNTLIRNIQYFEDSAAEMELKIKHLESRIEELTTNVRTTKYEDIKTNDGGSNVVRLFPRNNPHKKGGAA